MSTLPQSARAVSSFLLSTSKHCMLKLKEQQDFERHTHTHIYISQYTFTLTMLIARILAISRRVHIR